MAIHLRKRGEVWHARGTVRVGTTVVRIPEFSTGAGSRSAAEAVAAAREAEIRADHLDGAAGRTRRHTIADCIEGYAKRPQGLHNADKQRLRAMNDAIGNRPMADAPAAWREWVATHRKHRPGTLARHRNALLAALTHGAAAIGAPKPTLPPVAVPKVQPVPVLTDAERAALLRSYNPHAGCPVLVLAYQGMRTGEVLRLDWRDCQPARGMIHVRAEQTKSGRGRPVPMHPRVALLLWGMWEAAGRPGAGLVFLSARGDPYQDTRGIGGNPLKRAHETACRTAGVTRFRLHDWRHDWAARMVMGGVDLVTLMQLGGWQSLSMVTRYAAVSAEHLRGAAAVA